MAKKRGRLGRFFKKIGRSPIGKIVGNVGGVALSATPIGGLFNAGRNIVKGILGNSPAQEIPRSPEEVKVAKQLDSMQSRPDLAPVSGPTSLLNDPKVKIGLLVSGLGLVAFLANRR